MHINTWPYVKKQKKCSQVLFVYAQVASRKYFAVHQIVQLLATGNTLTTIVVYGVQKEAIEKNHILRRNPSHTKYYCDQLSFMKPASGLFVTASSVINNFCNENCVLILQSLHRPLHSFVRLLGLPSQTANPPSQIN